MSTLAVGIPYGDLIFMLKNKTLKTFEQNMVAKHGKLSKVKHSDNVLEKGQLKVVNMYLYYNDKKEHVATWHIESRQGCEIKV